MKKVVINKCYGGYSLSEEGLELYNKYKETNLKNCYNIERDDDILVRVVEELGKRSFGNCAELKVVEIPEDVNYIISEYDGKEWVAETHRVWN